MSPCRVKSSETTSVFLSRQQKKKKLRLIVHQPGSKYHLLEALVQVQVLKPKRASKQGPSFSPDSVFLGK